MDYEWLWVILAVGVLAPVGVVPFGLARDACCWWREHRRERREREMAGVSYERDRASAMSETSCAPWRSGDGAPRR